MLCISITGNYSSSYNSNMDVKEKYILTIISGCLKEKVRVAVV